MTTDEVDIFMEMFGEYFPDVAEWLRKQPGATITRWQEVFMCLDFSAAKASLPGFLKGDRDWPSSWGRWPVEISKACRQAQAFTTYKPVTYVDGQLTFRCWECQDSGWHFCWHPVSVRAMVVSVLELQTDEHPFGGPQTRYTCSVRCPCEAGEQWRHIAPVYSEREWVHCEGITHQPSIEALEAFVRKRLGSASN